MKKIVLGLGVAAMMFSASCKKDVGGLPDNSWSVSGKTYTSASVTVSPVSNFISAADAQGSALDVMFKNLPTANQDFNAQDVAFTNSDVAVRTVLRGNIVYNSIRNSGLVSIRVNAGKYTVIMNDIKMVNADNSADTVKVSSNIIQQ